MTRRSIIGNSNKRGFTLIESIVSVTIIGVAMLPILALINQSITQLVRVGDANDRAATTEAALAVLEPVNPMANPTGSTELGTLTLRWESETLVEPNDTIQPRAGLAGYNVGFYKVTVTLDRDNETWFSFDTRKVGFQRIQATGGPFQTGIQ